MKQSRQIFVHQTPSRLLRHVTATNAHGWIAFPCDTGITAEVFLDTSPAKIVLARHGQTVANRSGLVMGRSDSRLTREGIAQALTMIHIAKLEGIGTIFSSSLGRAALTASLYSEALRVPIHFREGMAELACGSWEGRPRTEVTGGFGRLRKTWTDRPPGGESYEDAESRVAAFIGEIVRVRLDGAVMVVGHASVNRVFLKLVLGMDPELAVRVGFSHHTLYVITADGQVRHLLGTGERGSGLLFEPG